MEKLIKLEIFEKRDDFDEKFKNFKKKYFFLREEKINLILDEISENDQIDRKWPEIYGSPHERTILDKEYSSVNLRELSHTIKDVYKQKDRYYANVALLNTINGKSYAKIDSNELYLHPAYLHGEIITLNIAIKMSVIYNRILDRK